MSDVDLKQYMTAVAKAMHQAEYADGPEFKLLSTEEGIFSQVDNMLSGIMEKLNESRESEAILTKKVEALQEQVDGYKDDYRAAYSAPCKDGVHCTCVPGLTKRAEVAEAERDTVITDYQDLGEHHAATLGQVETLRRALDKIEDLHRGWIGQQSSDVNNVIVSARNEAK